MSDKIIDLGHIIMESAQRVEEHRIVGESNGKIIAEGYLQTELSKKNRNGRIYGVPGIKKEVEGPRIKELKTTGNLKGENGHPSDNSLAVQQTINPDKVCVKYLDVWMDGDNVASRYCGTNNDRGEAFDKDLACGELPSFSLRCLGSLSQRGGLIYVENPRIVTWDRVYYPSHEKAYTTKIVGEASDNREKFHQEATSLTESGIIVPITTDSMRNFIKHESANVHNIMNSFDTLLESLQIVEDGRYAQIVTKQGQTLIINLENYVQNQIMDYCSKRV